MKTVSATVAIAMALAALPAGSIAQAPKAAVGAAFMTKNNRVTVAEVLPGGAGDLMGVRAGDVITHAGGRRVNNQTKLTAYIGSLKVGDPLELTVRRGGQSLQLTGKAMARQR